MEKEREILLAIIDALTRERTFDDEWEEYLPSRAALIALAKNIPDDYPHLANRIYGLARWCAAE